eukprot:UN05085
MSYTSDNVVPSDNHSEYGGDGVDSEVSDYHYNPHHHHNHLHHQPGHTNIHHHHHVGHINNHRRQSLSQSISTNQKIGK